MPKDRDKDISRLSRSVWSSGRDVPNIQQQAAGFYIGIVMDDNDDQAMGRIWVYFPAFSSKTFAETSIPRYGGTTPDKLEGASFDNLLRNGWILCYPMFSFFGNDSFRTPSSIDGRNSQQGDVNSYGMWYQPRIGDYVGVLFEHSDPSRGYWIGCVPKQYINSMVPGTPGSDKSLLRDDNALENQTVSGASIPTLDLTRDNSNGLKPALTLGENILYSGLAYDIHRGAGTSGARRESPSYVYGIKSTGWNFDSEKYNKNIDGSRFNDQLRKYAKVNTTGHTFVFDDHPDHQSIRLRTSAGSQIFFNDSCDNPYIYVTTARGNVWIELVDNGDINVFGEGSFSLHARNNINLTADRDINFEAFGNMNILVHGDMRTNVLKEVHTSITGNEFKLNSSSLHHTIERDHNTIIGNNFNHVTVQDYKQIINGNLDHIVGGTTKLETSGDFYNRIHGIYSEEAQYIFQNSNVISLPDEAEEPEKVNFPKLVAKPAPPTQEQILKNQRPSDTDYLGTIVPQHQPWPLRCGAGNTSGTNGYIGPNTFGTPANDTRCDTSNNSNNFRRGSTNPTAQYPDTYIGRLGNSPVPGIWVGNNYQSTNSSEEPTYTLGRLLDVNEFFPISNVNYSDNIVDFIKQQDTYQQVPTIDINGNPIIGYGHRIQVGDIINGTRITNEVLARLNSNSTSVSNIVMSETEADQFLRNELDVTQDLLQEQFNPNTVISQNQYDSLVSLARHVGVNNLTNTPQGQNIIQAIENGEPEQFMKNFMQFVNVNGQVNCDVVNRRKQELASREPNDNGIANQNRNSMPMMPVNCNNSKIDNTTLDALMQASMNNNVDYGTLVAFAGIESGFNPNAMARTSTATGLFQFTEGTWKMYNMDLNARTDPYASADAGAKLLNDNRNSLIRQGIMNPNTTDLYMAHFLGAGGAGSFLNGLQNNPGDLAINHVSPAQANANRNVFYNKDGSPKTLQQVYDETSNKVGRFESYSNCEPETTPA